MNNFSASLNHDIGFGHRRLSIIDLETGDQPMCNEDGSIWVTYNGEIYNFRELREQLTAKGHVFKTASDTEVILHGYEEWGEDCPARFNGIFAFALWDGRNQTLFLARDHFGVKPLYYHSDVRRFRFASEIKAILCDPAIEREIDFDALTLCLTFRNTPSPWTLFKGIKKLPPGHALCVTKADCRQIKFRDDHVAIDRRLTEPEWLERLRPSLDRAVARQMISDVPIGVSLSSGVDSNTVLALMARHSATPVNAFTVGFEGRDQTSEIEPARRMAKRHGAAFFSRVIRQADYATFMSRYIWHLEEPIGNESAAAYYFVAGMTRQQGIKVLLNGQGADETFAGYGRCIGAAYRRWLNLALALPFQNAFQRATAGTLLGERYHRFRFTLSAIDEADFFLRTYSIADKNFMRQLINPDVWTRMKPDLPHRYIKKQLADAPNDGTLLEKMTFMDARTILADNLLLCEDKMSMAASVEARVPFLDVELMSVAEQIPGRFKLKGLRDKYIHRKACTQWVDPSVTSRPQIGFDNAMDIWLKQQLGQDLIATTHDRTSFISNYLNPSFVRDLFHEHAAGRRDHQRVLFLLISLENWHRTFMTHQGLR